MDSVRAVLYRTSSDRAPKAHPRDKLEATKRHEREVRDAFKAEARRKLADSEQAQAAARAQIKEERMLHDTKRAAKDRRELQRRQEHAETGQTCDHGVWRCKICFPHKASK